MQNEVAADDARGAGDDGDELLARGHEGDVLRRDAHAAGGADNSLVRE